MASTQVCLGAPKFIIQNLEYANMGFKAMEKHIPAEYEVDGISGCGSDDLGAKCRWEDKMDIKC